MSLRVFILLVGLSLTLPVAAASLETLVSPGPLSAAHSAFATQCDSCHDPLGESTQQQLCSSCHENIASDMANLSGLHGKHPDVANNECQSCHREHRGEQRLLEFSWTAFNHRQTDFVLDGAHQALSCRSCHAPGVAHSATPTSCVSCHLEDDTHDGGLGADCGSCHTTSNWRATGFSHASTGFELLGGHATLECNSCHAAADFADAESACSSCHIEDDPHAGSLGNACGQCHTPFRWQPKAFNHAEFGGFALVGGHASASCQACHADQSHAALQGASCVSCHSEDDAHAGGFGSACESCHSVNAWPVAEFDHLGFTGFALTGAHQPLTCRSCHAPGDEASPPVSCTGCHSPDPHQQQLGQACETCHNDWVWGSELYFDHVISQFPLLGKHAELSCSTCHRDLQFHADATTCGGCHAEIDPHQGSLGSECENCHAPVSWSATAFDHNLQTSFELQGAHAHLSCASCHSNQGFMRASRNEDCGQCHLDPHGTRFGRDCGSCHTQDAFVPVGSLPK